MHRNLSKEKHLTNMRSQGDRAPIENGLRKFELIRKTPNAQRPTLNEEGGKAGRDETHFEFNVIQKTSNAQPPTPNVE